MTNKKDKAVDAPVVLEETEIYRGFLHLIRRRIRHPGGGVQDYEIVNPDTASASVVAFDDDNHIILVELYRFGQQRRLVELPAGGIKPGEAPLAAIKRELLEETGYTSDRFIEVGTYPIAAEHGVRRHVFAATGCRWTQPPTREQSELDEGMKVVRLSLTEFRDLLRSGGMTEVAAGYLALDALRLL